MYIYLQIFLKYRYFRVLSQNKNYTSEEENLSLSRFSSKYKRNWNKKIFKATKTKKSSKGNKNTTNLQVQWKELQKTGFKVLPEGKSVKKERWEKKASIDFTRVWMGRLRESLTIKWKSKVLWNIQGLQIVVLRW